MKIAIVGSGISGLVAAHLLHRDHELTVLEAGNHIGGHTNTVRFELDGRDYSIDTGFIVYNNRNYPLFSRLLDELGVVTKPTSMSFSVRCQGTGLEYRGADLNGLFVQRRNLVSPRFYNLLWHWLRFSRAAERQLASQPHDLTVGQFFNQFHYSRSFIKHYFLPMASAIWSCPTHTVRDFPMQFIVEFYKHHGLLSLGDRPQWRVIEGGSYKYVQKLI